MVNSSLFLHNNPQYTINLAITLPFIVRNTHILAYNFPNTFGAIGAYSTASFLCADEFYNFINNNIDPNIRLFLYVGRRETSDGSYDEELYFNASKIIYDIALKHNGKVRLVVSDSGTHCEACWDKNLIDFFSFIHSDGIIYKY